MRKILPIIVLIFAVFTLIACGNGNIIIHFDSNGGSIVESINYSGETNISIPDNPTKEGFVFDGWFWDNETFQRPFTVNSFLELTVKSNITVYAKWVKQDSELTMQLKSIYLLAVQTEEFQGTYEQWLETVRGPEGVPGEDGKSSLLRINEGYLEWQIEGNSTWIQLFDLNSLKGQEGKNISLQVSDGYIQWQYVGDASWTNLISLGTLTGQDGIDGREVNFQVSDGYIQWQYVGDTSWTNLIEISTLTGLPGVGISSTEINQQGELIIHYTNGSIVNLGSIFVMYLVQFKDHNGHIFDVQYATYGGSVNEPMAPTIVGYQFIGFDCSFDNITSNTVIKALYEIQKFSFIFDSNGGSYVNDITNIEYSSLVDLPTPTKEGYVFAGWFYGNSINDGQFTSQTKVERSLTLYARWSSTEFSVIFLDYDDTILKEVEVITGKSAFPPETPTRIGYTFIGWDISYSNILKDTVVRAVYDINKYTIKFNTNGGSSINDITQDYDSVITEIIPLKLGYDFVGWYSDSLFSTSYTLTTMPAENITLYAKWEIINYTITYVVNDGINSINNPDSYQVTSSIALSDAYKEGYIFRGWYDNKDLTGDVISLIQLGSTGNIILYAKWDINSYTITYRMMEEDYDPLYHIKLFVGETIIQVSLGSQHSSALTSTGRLFMWGRNNYGQLGDGTVIDKNIPTEITNRFGLSNEEKITQISLGSSHSSALTSTGRVFMWGRNNYGQLGDGTVIDKNIPTEITNRFGLSNEEKITQISLGSSHSSALSSTGRVFIWGYNYNSQLGDSTLINKNIPTEITNRFGLSNNETIIQVALGENHSSALTSTGRVFVWGYNACGQLGDATLTDKNIPTEITNRFSLIGEEKISQISLGSNHSSAISSTGRLFLWGYNYHGQIGDGTTINKILPTEITNRFGLSNEEKIIQFSLGGSHSSALTSTGRLFMWGNNYNGQLGNITTTNRNSPTYITNYFNITDEEKITQISLGNLHSSAITSTGRFFVWGYNYEGQLGDGTTINKNIPTEITLFKSSKVFTSLTYIYHENINQFIPNKEGYIFLGWYTDLTFISLSDLSIMPANDIVLFGYWSIINYDITYHLDDGINHDNNPNSYTVFDEITLFNPTKIGYNFLGWYDNEGLTGEAITTISLGSTINVNLYAKWEIKSYTISYLIVEDDYEPLSYIPLFPEESIIKVSLGYYNSAALTSTGRLFIWGNNFYGQLGDGTKTGKIVPIEITSCFSLSSEEKIIEVSLGEYNSSALTSTGRLFMWGNNYYGQLGDGTTADKTSPTEITSYFKLTSNEKIIKVVLGCSHSSALTSTGRLFTWGYNYYGRLGDGTTNNKNIPTEITSNFNLTSEEKIIDVSLGYSHSSALTSSGRLFTWGFNAYGQLGDGTYNNNYLPTEITRFFNLTNDEIVHIDFKGGHSSALTSTGRLFLWGYNSYGQIGDGTIVNKTSPTEITSFFNLTSGETITQISIGDTFSSALTSSGRLFIWGDNTYGQLGDGTTAAKSTPIEITNRFNLTNDETIIQVFLKRSHSSALSSSGRLFMWGYNTSGQLGNGTTASLSTPTEIIFKKSKEFVSVSYYLNENIIEYLPIRDGYLFMGWYKDLSFANLFDLSTMPEYSSILYGQWTIINYDINYYLNEGNNHTGNPNSYTILDDITLLNPSKTGYNFLGWYDNEEFSGNQVTKITLGSTETVNLYAKWEIIEYNIIYELGGGINSTENPLTYQVTSNIILSEPSKEDYTFMGWYDNESFTGEAITSIQAGTTDDIILYAKWMRFTITYSLMEDDYDPLNHISLYLGESIIQVSLGGYHSSALTSAGRLFMWGRNDSDQLGDGTNIEKVIPTEITSFFTLATEEIIIQVSLGNYHSAALTSNGRLFMWGGNFMSQLGDGTTIKKSNPIEITNRFNLTSEESIIQASLGGNHSSALTSTGRLFTWGGNDYGQLGDGTILNKYTPTDITSRFGLNIDETIIQITSGDFHSAALTSTGRVFMWGRNSYGQLGDETIVDRYIPTEITSLFGLNIDETIIHISLGCLHSSALTSAGRLFVWGYNGNNQLGDGTFINKLIPTEITNSFSLSTDEHIVLISLGGIHSTALTSIGRVFMWGYNEMSAPTEITSLFSLISSETIIHVFLGYSYSAALTSTGRVFMWGNNYYGQLGDGTKTNKTTPITIFKYPTEINSVTHNFNDSINSYIPYRDGYTFVGWYKDLTLTNLFDQTAMPKYDIVLYGKWNIINYDINYYLDGGYNHVDNPISYTILDEISLIDPIKTGYSFLGWYDNSDFTGSKITTLTFGNVILYAKWEINSYTVTYVIVGDDYDPLNHIQLYPEEIITHVSLGYNHSSAITSIGRVFMWGYNYTGQLGDGTTTNKENPTEITSLFGLSSNETIIQISLGENHSSAITSTGRIFMWGRNNYGQLGDGTTLSKTTPIEITNQFSLTNNETIIQVSLGENHSSAITSTGRIFMWGNNYKGQLGTGMTNSSSDPIEITANLGLGSNEKVIQISLKGENSSALTSTGRLFMWGNNTFGQLGDGTTTQKLIPTEITNHFGLTYDEKIIQISLSVYSSSALTCTGRVFMWGLNSSGELGDGTTIDRTTPIEITSHFSLTSNESIIQVSLGRSYSSALTSTGSLFVWGSNYVGQLGDGTTLSNYNPTNITNHFNLTTGETIVLVSLGNIHSSALTSLGRLFMWGHNYYYQLGDGTTIDKHSPTELTIFKSPMESYIDTYYYIESINEFMPNRDGYTLNGWYIDPSLLVLSDITLMPALNIVLFGQWNIFS